MRNALSMALAAAAAGGLLAAAGPAGASGSAAGPLVDQQGGLDSLPPPPPAAAGRVILQCTVNADRSVGRCLVVKEWPKGHGLGDAALRLYQQIRLDPDTFAPEMVGQKVQVPIDFARDQDAGDMPPAAEASPPKMP